ncbi:MAG: hypothetical protein EA398_01025 [Deltaproteobacteria bacterium]|nr:MAG: hypothetical protein EA398_01025 [Deltaproteobacteria bacterium]
MFRQLLLLALVVVIVPAAANASPVEVFGASARSASMVGALVADPVGPDAVYHNVGGLARVAPTAGIGMVFLQDRSVIRLKDRPAGYDIPNLGGTGPAVPTERELAPRSDTTGDPPMAMMQIGIVSSLGLERFRFGLLASLPVHNGAPQGGFFPDERERLFTNRLHFELLGDRVRRFDVRGAVGIQLTDRLSLGLGAAWLPRVETRNDVYLQNPTDQENVDLVVQARQASRLGLSVGLLFEPMPGLRLGVSARDALAMRLTGGNVIRIRGFEDDPETWPVEQRLDLTPFYSPSSLSTGVSGDLGDWTLSAEAQFERWSSYRDRQNAQTDFSDRVSGRLGLEFRYSDDTTVRGGLGFVPTPVPAQTGRTNYVDNSRLLTSLGASHGVQIFGNELEVAWFTQIHFLLPRDTDKVVPESIRNCGPGITDLCDELPDDLRDPRTGRPIPEAGGLQTGNPGFPGFVSGGWMAAAGLEVSWKF